MQKLILLLALIIGPHAMAEALHEGTTLVPGKTASFDTYTLYMNIHDNSSILVVGGEITHGCFPRYRYEATRSRGKIFVTKTHNIVPAVVCDPDMAREHVEELRLKLTAHDRYATVYVTEGEDVRVEKKAPSLPPIQFCTAQYAIMIHPVTKKCVPASNGCAIRNLRKAGYKIAEPNECKL